MSLSCMFPDGNIELYVRTDQMPTTMLTKNMVMDKHACVSNSLSTDVLECTVQSIPMASSNE